MKAPELTPAMLSKRAARERKLQEQQTFPDAIAAAAAAATAEAEEKRVQRRLRDAADAETLRAWSIKDDKDEPCTLIDIGANLVKVKGDGALEEQLRRCALTGVTRVLVTGTALNSSQRALDLVRKVRSSRPNLAVEVFSTAGVHPHDAKSYKPQHTVAALRELLSAPECVAVGETGLDYDRMFSPREVQIQSFEEHARLAVELNKPLFLHERDLDPGKGPPLGSHEDLIDVLERTGVKPEQAVIHCFTGSAAHLKDYVERGFRIGLTGFAAMEQRGAHVREALRAGVVPLSCLMLETDAPFMRPDKAYLPDVKALKRGQCEPCLVPAVANAVAECLGVPPAEVAKVTTENARAFFRLP